MKINFLILFCLMMMSMRAQRITSFDKYLKSNKQVLFVKTPTENSVQGKMYLYERKNKRREWKPVDSFAVVIGKNGLAKAADATIAFNNSIPIKHEGDGKSPAGIFKLGSVFSYHTIDNLKMPFVQVDTNFYCVDDTGSSYYNTLIVADTAKHNFNSFEYMKRNDNFYEYGVWVLHNSNPVIAADGSCIFLHIWRNENSGTAGCTAMSKEHILELIHWLDKKKNPVLLQVVENNHY